MPKFVWTCHPHPLCDFAKTKIPTQLKISFNLPPTVAKLRHVGIKDGQRLQASGDWLLKAAIVSLLEAGSVT